MGSESKTSNEKIKSAGLRGVQNRKAWKFIREANSDLRQLSHIAIEDGTNIYSYGVMFRNWDRYASVFSALGMTGENKARVGMMGSMSAEAIFVFYALNMVGAEISIVPSYSVFRPERVKQTIREEKLTDFILTDDFAQPNLIKDLHDRKKELGLRNVILLHVPLKGDSINPVLTAFQEIKWMFLRSRFFPIAMENLLAAHENDPVCYASEESHDSAFILHTSGTTGGTGKPVILSDKAFNAVPLSFSKLTEFEAITKDPVVGLGIDLSNAYGIIDQVHLPLAFGGTIAVAPAGVLNPNFHKAIPEFKMTVVFAISALYERWLKMPENTQFDFSSLKCVVTGGSAVSAKDKKRYCEFLKTHGAEDFIFVNGYGISEVGGAACLSTADPEDESIGYLLPGFDFRLYDEDKGKYLSLKDASCEGMLYLTSPSCANPMMDGKKVLEITMLNRKPFVCTNDIVRVEADGKITFLGQGSRYFINDSNRKFEAGRLETEIARQNSIESCCVVPVYIKTIHDNIPMLCVKTLPDDKPDLCIVKDVLRKVFVTAGSYLALYVSAMHVSEKLQNIIGYKPSRMRYAAIGTICGMFYTNDLMRVNEDGSLSFAGRADKYFVNNEGRKFDSGIVDMQMSAQSAVDRCAVVPVMDKRIHDTVPVLYVVPAEKGPQAAESIRQAFVDVYVKNKSIPAENLPSQFMIVDDIPLNPNGKLDIYRITRERLEGDAWNLIPVMDKDQLADIRTEHREHVNSMTGGTLPHGMENNSAYNIFDFFTGGSGENADDPITKTLEFLKRKDMKPWDIFNPFMHYKLLMPDDPEKKLKMPEIPQNVRKAGLKYVNRFAGIPYGRKSIDVDFEED